MYFESRGVYNKHKCMTSFVVASTVKERRVAYINEYCRELGIDKFDVSLIEKDSSAKNVASIGIDEIKDIHKKIFLKPIKSEVKAVILDDAQLLTIQAQNALLKVLEEPPIHTIIILGVDTTEALLPTILSRCQIIELPMEPGILSDAEIPEYSEFIENLQSMKIGDRLKKAEELAKDKDEAIIWIGKLILALRTKMLEENNGNLEAQQIKTFQNLYTLLKTTNVNPRFAIENTLLNLNS